MNKYIVVCEGYSERAYLQRLQSFLENQSTIGWDVPLKFIPLFTKNKNGHYKSVEKGFKDARTANKGTVIQIWVDYDLYFRNDKDNMTQYLKKPAGIPDFHFSFHNFEDFLVMHMEDQWVRAWRELVEPTGHFRNPLHSRDHEPHFRKMIPGYRKGDLSPDFISRESLLRLKKSVLRPVIPPPDHPGFLSFAKFVIDEIEKTFPTLLV